MKTIFDRKSRVELVERIAKIDENDTPEWGQMTVFDMLAHNTYWNKWMLGMGNYSYKQSLLGKIFGKIALKRMIKDEKPFDKNIPTSEHFKVKGKRADFATEKRHWVTLIHAYENYDNPKFVHDFLGKLKLEEIGILAYKHSDHHLRQFGK